MFILVPPSEGKSHAAGKATFTATHPDWAADTRAVLAMLQECKPSERAKWYGVKDTAKAKEWHTANLAVLETGGVPAVERYTGVVYQHLDYPSLKERAAARRRLLFVSALFGVIPAGTPIPSYKLPINPTLTRHWRPINTARLEALARGKPVINLLSQAYAKTMGYEPLITLDFKVAGGKKSAGHLGKAIKGRFLRFLVEENVTDVDDFARFTEDGYQWDGTNFVRS